MFKHTKNGKASIEKETAVKTVEEQLSDSELAKVAGGVPPRGGGTGAEI